MERRKKASRTGETACCDAAQTPLAACTDAVRDQTQDRGTPRLPGQAVVFLVSGATSARDHPHRPLRSECRRRSSAAQRSSPTAMAAAVASTLCDVDVQEKKRNATQPVSQASQLTSSKKGNGRQ